MAGEKLKVMPNACPFCGNIPNYGIIFKEAVLDSSFEFAAVRCITPACQVRPGVGATMEKGWALDAAIRRWNIRKSK